MLILCLFLCFAFALQALAQTFGPARPLLAPARAPRVGIVWGGA